jgi:hypothetical protein
LQTGRLFSRSRHRITGLNPVLVHARRAAKGGGDDLLGVTAQLDAFALGELFAHGRLGGRGQTGSCATVSKEMLDLMIDSPGKKDLLLEGVHAFEGECKEQTPADLLDKE